MLLRSKKHTTDRYSKEGPPEFPQSAMGPGSRRSGKTWRGVLGCAEDLKPKFDFSAGQGALRLHRPMLERRSTRGERSETTVWRGCVYVPGPSAVLTSIYVQRCDWSCRSHEDCRQIARRRRDGCLYAALPNSAGFLTAARSRCQSTIIRSLSSVTNVITVFGLRRIQAGMKPRKRKAGPSF